MSELILFRDRREGVMPNIAASFLESFVSKKKRMQRKCLTSTSSAATGGKNALAKFRRDGIIPPLAAAILPSFTASGSFSHVRKPERIMNQLFPTRFRGPAIVAGAILVLIFLGCMNLSIGGRTYSTSDASPPEDGVFAQEGTVHVKSDSDLDIYYPVPYQRPPNLVLKGETQTCEIVEQKEDHFRIHNPRGFQIDITWKARGLRLAQAPATSTPATSASTTSTPTITQTSATLPAPDPTPSK
jgi:hypothetical protein